MSQALDPQPGSRVVDMCAAPGGKATALAQLMGDTGTLVALERSANKVTSGLNCNRFHLSGANANPFWWGDSTRAGGVSTAALLCGGVRLSAVHASWCIVQPH